MILPISLLLILSFSCFLAGCNSAGDFKSGGAIAVTRNDSGKDKRDSDENEIADEPVEVSGSFLTCAFMDTETEVVYKAQHEPAASLEIACGLFRQIGDGFGPVDDSRLKLQTRILTNQGKLIPADFRRLPLGTQMQHITTVPVKHLSGTIHVDYFDPATATYSSRRKSIPSITSFSAKTKYDVSQDESVRRYLTKELPLNGSIDPQDTVVPEEKVGWWMMVLKIIVEVYGKEAAVPASYDNGSTVYKPIKQVKYPSAKPELNSVDFPINQPNKPVATKPGTKPNSETEQGSDPLATKPPSVDDSFVPVDMSENKPDSKSEGQLEKPAIAPIADPISSEGGGNPTSSEGSDAQTKQSDAAKSE